MSVYTVSNQYYELVVKTGLFENNNFHNWKLLSTKSDNILK